MMTYTHLDDVNIAELIEGLSVSPESVQQVLALIDDIDCHPRDLVRAVEHDPMLNESILRVLNFVFRRSCRITSMKEALALISLNTIKHVILAIASVGDSTHQI